MTDAATTPLVWAIHDGRVGIRNQALGLAEAVGYPVVEKEIDIKFPWTHLPARFWLGRQAPLGPDGRLVSPPWPDLLVTCGNRSVGLAAAIKAASGGRTMLVQVQKPAVGRRHFDLIVVPEHDGMTGANALVTKGAVHRVTPERLAAAAARFGPVFADLPRPLVAVLIGGANRVYELTQARFAALADQLAALARAQGAGLLVTPSRRTGAEGEQALRERLTGLPAYIWDGTGENPYFGFLALADAIIVTCDSVSMVSEAGSTGKPVHVIELEGGSAKFRAFHDVMRRAGVTRPFDGRLAPWHYTPLDDTERAAAEIRRRLAQRGVGRVDPARAAE